MKRLWFAIALLLWLGATCRRQPEPPVRIQEIRRPGPISLNKSNPRLETSFVSIGEMSADFTLRLRRPTSTNSVKWPEDAKVKVVLETSFDAEIFKAEGQASGGIRVDRDKKEMEFYQLRYGLPIVAVNDTVKRIGETRKNLFAKIRLELVAGDSVETQLLVAQLEEKPRPNMKIHHSVAFDAATDAQEVSGDGVLTLSHAIVSSSNAVLFLGCASSSGTGGELSNGVITYGAQSSTELWDNRAGSSFHSSSGFYLIAPNTGSQTVTSTLNDSPDEHTLGVISMTGVHQTTAVGTPQKAGSTTGNATVTVTSTDADGLIIDYLATDAQTITIGANQTIRNTEDISGHNMRMSEQDGGDGGVMSWSTSSFEFSSGWELGAVEFKPAAAGGGDYHPGRKPWGNLVK